MKRYATTLFVLLCLAATTGLVQAQTVREIKSVPQANLAELMQLGAALTADDIERLGRSEFENQKVTFTAVVLAEPRNSGLASLNNGQPGRVHFFVRDTAAVSQGAEGMDIQIVSGNPAYRDQGVIGLFKGDVVRVTGEMQYFNEVNIQIAPETIEPLGDIQSLGLPASILDPIPVTTSDLTQNMGEAQIQFNWENFNDLNQAFVRIEDATVWRSPNRTDARPNWAVTSDGAQTIVVSDDVSLCFRNDKKDYPADFAECKDDDFQGPAPGAVVNVEGFATIRGTFDPFNIGAPAAAIARLVPWEAEDLVVTAQPAITGVSITPPAEVPGEGPIPVTVSVEGDLSVVTSVTVIYETADGTPTTITLTSQGDGTYTGEIPAQPDGAFLSYTAEVTDNTGSTYNTPAPTATRVLYEGINDVADVQETVSGGTGPSVFEDATLPMSIEATVQSDPTNANFLFVQDDVTPWSGIFVEVTEAIEALGLMPGDQVRITEGTVVEIRGDIAFNRSGDVTGLSGVTLEKTGTGTPLTPVTISTGVLSDLAVAEAHEGMLIRVEDVVVTTNNADAPSNFGEFAVATEGQTNTPLRVDDIAGDIPNDYNVTTFQGGERLTFVQGVLTYSFGNYKLLPRSLADIGTIVDTATDEETVPGTFALGQNYPNPFNPVTTIQYEVAAAGRVTLEVVDVLGRTVATLVDAEVTPGAHTVRFDGRDLASGLYLYRLTAGAQTITKKMMLMK